MLFFKLGQLEKFLIKRGNYFLDGSKSEDHFLVVAFALDGSSSLDKVAEFFVEFADLLFFQGHLEKMGIVDQEGPVLLLLSEIPVGWIETPYSFLLFLMFFSRNSIEIDLRFFNFDIELFGRPRVFF